MEHMCSKSTVTEVMNNENLTQNKASKIR